jgi:F-type H+-transporting ATPase subunit b
MNLNPLDQLEPVTIAATVGIFTLTYAALRRFVFVPLVSVMEDRREHVDAGLDAGREAKRLTDEANAAAASRVEQARADAEGRLEAARERWIHERDARVAQAQAAAQKQLDEGRAKIVLARETEIETLRHEALDCVGLACSKLEVPVDPKTAEAVVDAVIAKRVH